jgi:hypothetical protein
LTKLLSARWKIYWLLFVITTLIYLVMIFWSLPKLSEFAGGDLAFDLRPAGYSIEEAKTFIGALGSNGIDFYIEVQQRLDSLYPALLAIVLVGGLLGLDFKGWGWVFSVFAIAGSVFDYLENAAVRVMLQMGPDGLTAEMAEQASGWTLLKSISATIAMGGLLILVLIALYRYFFMRKSVLPESSTPSNGDEAAANK